MFSKPGPSALFVSTSETLGVVAKNWPKKKFTACNRCRARKSKCSGERPCESCIATGTGNSCSFPVKDRTLKIRESYLKRILAENETAKQNTISASTSTRQAILPDPADAPAETNVSNPLIEDQAWFVPYTHHDVPVYIGESSSAAFATSLRQVLDDSCTRDLHAPRTHYVLDTSLFLNPISSTPWPSEVKAQLFVRVALTHIGRSNHVVLASATFSRLQHIYQDLSCITEADVGKFFTLFALGEAYSITSKPADGREVPGLAYFIAASKIGQNIPERATLACIENLILLSLYSHILNRRHSAYHFIGLALRLSMTLGLHHGLPQCFTLNPVLRQHRIRIWWTIYDLDRMYSSELGHPPSVQDNTVTVEMPSMTDLDDQEKEDFLDSEYLVAKIKLASIVGDTMTDVYNRNQTQPFLRSVNTILQKLRGWKTNLPASLKLSHTDNSTSLPRNVICLHLAFHQAVVFVTRPVLLHIFKRTLGTSSDQNIAYNPPITPLISDLASSSIDAARHIHELQSEAWISGTLPRIGSFDSLYIFSSAAILAISSILAPAGPDKLSFETACQILQTLAENGNLSSAQLFTHLDRVQKSVSLHLQNISNEEYETGYRANADTIYREPQSLQTDSATNATSMQTFALENDAYAGNYLDFLGPFTGFEGEFGIDNHLGFGD